MQALSLPPEYLNVRRMSLDNLEYEASQHLVHSRSLSLLGESIDDAHNTSQSSIDQSHHKSTPLSLEEELRKQEEEEIFPESTCENIEVIIPVKLKERLSISSLKSCKSESCLSLTDIPTKVLNREEPDETPKGRREPPPPQYLKLPTNTTTTNPDKFHQHLLKKTFVLKKSFSENHSSIDLHNRLQTFKFPPSSSTSELCNYD